MSEATSRRTYTTGEIDAMRDAIYWSYPKGDPWDDNERCKEVERTLRTYIMGGVDPNELIERFAAIGKMERGKLEAQ